MEAFENKGSRESTAVAPPAPDTGLRVIIPMRRKELQDPVWCGESGRKHRPWSWIGWWYRNRRAVSIRWAWRVRRGVS